MPHMGGTPSVEREGVYRVRAGAGKWKLRTDVEVKLAEAVKSGQMRDSPESVVRHVHAVLRQHRAAVDGRLDGYVVDGGDLQLPFRDRDLPFPLDERAGVLVARGSVPFPDRDLDRGLATRQVVTLEHDVFVHGNCRETQAAVVTGVGVFRVHRNRLVLAIGVL